MKLTAFSDTHLLFPNEMPPTKFGVYCGDYQSEYDDLSLSIEIAKNFFKWYSKQPYNYHILISGNHDLYFWLDPEGFKQMANSYGIIVLDHEMITIDGLRIFGTPYWYSHKYNKDNLRVDEFPEAGYFDVLLTHVPPFGILDFAQGKMENCGSKELREYVQANKPKLHLFGHIHEAFQNSQRPFMNVSLRGKDKKKGLINRPTVLDVSSLMELEKKE